ncbi:efflux RND transporter permease subunit [Brucepastera parasyntrophica]|uniref:efflux RND transporter permease subunit n=1 Tax=Brucepastera parasyntrophica TaxID=2880008 RepID=UPI002108A687|nr:efflux RND transporter permease subunit [Brucepastera parasyntrophica]ULQ58726.1 efflux RND transporter permease subunit [Brucepastera parasyntrophica]
MSVAKSVVNRPVLFVIIFALIAIVGIYMVSDVAIDMFPDIDIPMVIVYTSYDSAGPETVEKTVTKILESALVNISGLTDMTSQSSEETSLIMLEFEYGSNLDNKVNDIRDKIDQIRDYLPDASDSPIIMQMDPSSMPIMRIAVKGDRTQNELRKIADDMILDKLEQIDGVASTSVVGGQDRIVKVSLSQNRLEAYGLTITDIARTLASQNVELGAGSIVDGAKNYSIRTTGEYSSLLDISETVVTKIEGADIRLRDIGDVFWGYEDENSTVYINGELGVYVSVTKQSGTNSVAVADKVYARLDEIRQELPADITLEITQDDTEMTRDMINELINSAVLGGVLAVIILIIFLRNIKSSVIIAISIPFSILVTLLVMSLAGITLNMMTLTGLILGVGMIVDSSIVIIENIFKFRERGAKPTIAAILGTQEVMSSIISSTLTTICVFIPILLFKNQLGMMGQMVEGLIFTVGIALLSSLLVAIFLVPVLASKYLPINTRTQKPLKSPILRSLDSFVEKLLAGLTRAYRRALDAAVKHRMITIIIIVAAFLGSVGALSKMNIVMIPPMNEDSVSVSVEMPLGTRYEDTRAVMLQLQEFAIDEIVGAKSIITNVGSSGQALQTGVNTHKGELSITLDLNQQGADTSETVKEKLRAHFGDFPNATITFGEGMAQQMAGGSDIDIALRIDDINIGLAAATEIKDIIEEFVPEVTEVTIDTSSGLPQVEIVIDRNRAYNLGLNISGIANEIAAAMDGVTATTYRYEGDEYDVVLMFQDEDRKKVVDLDKIFVSSSYGGIVPLSNFASLDKGVGPVSISRENQTRVIHITGTILTNDRADVVENKIKDAINSNYVLPNGVTIVYEGQWGEITDMLMTFILILTLAVLLVFGVMAGQYESFKDPLINLCTIPLMLIGVVAIYLITGQTMSIFTMIGLVMLVGIVVNNGIILVDYTNLLVGRGVPVRQACLDAGESRLRPVLMTTLTTVLGMVPMAFFPGESSQMIQPIGLTVIGGLVSSTFITLFFIPVMYSIINEHRGKKQRKEKDETIIELPLKEGV